LESVPQKSQRKKENLFSMKENWNLRCAAESSQSQISIYNQSLLRLPEGVEAEVLAGIQSIHKHRRIGPRNFEVK